MYILIHRNHVFTDETAITEKHKHGCFDHNMVHVLKNGFKKNKLPMFHFKFHVALKKKKKRGISLNVTHESAKPKQEL